MWEGVWCVGEVEECFGRCKVCEGGMEVGWVGWCVGGAGEQDRPV